MTDIINLNGFPGKITLTSYEPQIADWAEYEGLATMLEAIKQGHQWWIGDLALYGEKFYPSQFTQAWMAAQFDLSEVRISTYMAVCRAFPTGERFGLPLTFKHHEETLSLDSHTARRRALEIALAKRKTSGQLRTEIRAGKMLEKQNTPTPATTIKGTADKGKYESSVGGTFTTKPGSTPLSPTLSSAFKEADSAEGKEDYREYTQQAIEMQVGVPDLVAQDALDALAALLPTLKDKELREPLSRLVECFLGHGFSVKHVFPNTLYIYKRERYKNPSLTEVLEYSKEKGKDKEYGEKFWRRYESQGWKVGPNFIKDWKVKFDEWLGREAKGLDAAAMTDEETAAAMELAQR